MINFELLIKSIPLLIKGASISLLIAFGAMCLGLFGGTIIAVMQRSKNKFFRIFANSYVTIVRGTPMLIQIWLMLTFFSLLGIWNILAVAVVALGLNSAAYMSQTINAGICAVGKGQIEAAQVLGFNSNQIWRLIVLPQAFRAVISPMANEIITLIKDSSLASVIGVYELLKEGRTIISQTYDPFTVYFAVGILYLIMTGLVSLMFKHLERKYNGH